MFNDNGDIVCLLNVVVDYMLVGSVFQCSMLTCDSRPLMVMVGIGSYLIFSCVFALGVVF